MFGLACRVPNEGLRHTAAVCPGLVFRHTLAVCLSPQKQIQN